MGNNVFYLFFYHYFTINLLLYIFYVCGSLCIIDKKYIINKIMVKKIK